mmetsp:Transcript_8394/g.17598  ORF Transcript_8394/g.17598 Transcript_8394/m.17598 type:complete len:237 (-) Transcript_8394:2227-2937(-)
MLITPESAMQLRLVVTQLGTKVVTWLTTIRWIMTRVTPRRPVALMIPIPLTATTRAMTSVRTTRITTISLTLALQDTRSQSGSSQNAAAASSIQPISTITTGWRMPTRSTRLPVVLFPRTATSLKRSKNIQRKSTHCQRKSIFIPRENTRSCLSRRLCGAVPRIPTMIMLPLPIPMITAASIAIRNLLYSTKSPARQSSRTRRFVTSGITTGMMPRTRPIAGSTTKSSPISVCVCA